MKRNLFFLLSGSLLALSGCSGPGTQPAANGEGHIKQSEWGKTADGKTATLYTLSNGAIETDISDFGGVVTALRVPDRNGKLADVVLSYPSFNYCDTLTQNYPYFGALIGRYGNRIREGKFPLDGKEYHLAINNPPNSLHGGTTGFNKHFWEASASQDHDSARLTLRYTSPDMEEGYPGTLKVTVTYTLAPDTSLIIDYTATTDKPTILNLTNHSYFNLSGQLDSSCLGEELYLNADHYLPIDSTFIPTGEILNVRGTPMDFTRPKAIGRDIGADFLQLKYAHGYDHNWVLNKKEAHELSLAAIVKDPGTGREMQVYTTQPGVQFYSGNFLSGGVLGNNGKPHTGRDGFCLETQHFPDSPNRDYFPSPVLQPGQVYHERTIYKFGTF